VTASITYLDRANRYARQVVGGEIPACRLTIQAAQRHLDDLARVETDPKFKYRFDPIAVAHICAFVEALPHVEGDLAGAGAKLILDDWQVFILASINGWRHYETGLRRFRRAYVEVPRKNGKSTLLAAVGLYFLSVDGEAGAKVYSAAASTHQARIVFDVARLMAMNGTVETKFGVQSLAAALGFEIQQHKLLLSRDGAAVFQPIASQTKSKDGKNPHLAIIDELHEHEKPDVYNSMSSALGARSQPLLISITTAGSNVGGICYDVHRYTADVVGGVRVDDSFFGIIYGADAGDDAGDPATWRKANPALGTAKSETYIADEWKTAQANPVQMGEFLRKHLNRWTSIGAAAFDLDALTRAQAPALLLGDLQGREAWIGVDLSLTNDLTSVVATIPEGDGYILKARHFATEMQIQAPGNSNLEGWSRLDGPDGHKRLEMCSGARINDAQVEAAIIEFATILDVQEVDFDPWRAASLGQSLSNQGLPCVEFRQTPMNMTPPFEHAIGVVADDLMITDGDPVLYWMFANAICRQNGDFMRLEKLDKASKIDGVSATLTALGRILSVAEAPEAPTPWDLDPNYRLAG